MNDGEIRPHGAGL